MDNQLVQQIARGPNGWLFTPIAKNIYQKNQHFSLAVCGNPGSGKSYLAMRIAQILYPQFKPKHSVVFSAKDFAELISQDHPKGFPIILDDAGLAAFSGDALTQEVKAISKIVQSVRHRNWQIILTLPRFFLLAKSVRDLFDYYAEPKNILYKQNICLSKFQWIDRNPKYGGEYFWNFERYVKEKTWFGYEKITPSKISIVEFKKPNAKTCNEYEKLKDERMKAFNLDTSQILDARYDKLLGKNKRVTTKDIAKEIAPRIRDYLKDGNKLDFIKVMNEFGVSHMSARNAVKMAAQSQEINLA